MATYAIGDIQGCFGALNKMMNRIHFDPAHDRLWFVGDLVNRGPESLQVLRFIRGLGKAAMTVLGNHDLHLLAVWTGTAKQRRKDTIQDVLSAPDCDELLTWLRHRPLIYREQEYIVLHAGLLPQWSIPQAMTLAHEVEQALRAKNFRAHLPDIYVPHSPFFWTADLSLNDRLGAVANVMTRLRVCSLEGTPDFSFTGPPADSPNGFLPWFDIPSRLSKETTIVCGHWSALGVLVRNNIMALDGGCVWGRKLVAIRLEDRKLFHVSCQT